MNTTFKFGLTLAAAVVLTACGSSGGKSNNNTTSNTTAETTTPAVVTPTTPTVDAPSLVVDSAVEYGGKFVKKNESNFRIPGTNGSSDSSGAATPMTVALYPSLDTIVIASQTDNQGNALAGSDLIYLEDFDFRQNVSSGSFAATDGRVTLSHIHKLDPYGSPANADAKTLGKGVTRTGGATVTKTKLKGEQSGTALVYDAAPNTDAKYVDRAAKEGVNHVAEVYGYRTLVSGNSEEGKDFNPGTTTPSTKATAGEIDAANTPLIKARLYNVQYGRVTHTLNGLVEADLRKGLPQGQYTTRIATYADYALGSNQHVENSYFFRGVNPTAAAMKKNGADLVTALKEKYADGKIKYSGHAVTYGFDNTYTAKNVVATAQSGVPNAIGTTNTNNAVAPVLKSGTHVDATVNLNNYNVSGNLYNVYKVGTKDEAIGIADFTGTLTTFGNVEGTSTRTSDKAEGSFKATLFGVNATELGGAISSNKTAEGDSWGAVFGAKAGAATGIGVATDSNKASE